MGILRLFSLLLTLTSSAWAFAPLAERNGAGTALQVRIVTRIIRVTFVGAVAVVVGNHHGSFLILTNSYFHL